MSHADKASPRFRKLSAGRSFDDKDQRLRKTRALSVYLSPDENRMVRLEAEKLGLGLSDFLRHQALLEVRYGRNSLIEQIQQLSRDNRNDPELEYQLRALVKDLTGVALAPPVAPPAPEPVQVAAMPPAPPVPLPPAAVDLPVQLTNPEAVFSPVLWLSKIGAITLTVLGDVLGVVTDLVAGIWRWLIRSGSRVGHRIGRDSMYDRVVGRTPLQFLVATTILATLPVVAFGRTDVGLYLLGTNDPATASTVLEHLPDDVQRRYVIGYLVEEKPENVARLSACLKQQQTSQHDFWCKFRMKAGA